MLGTPAVLEDNVGPLWEKKTRKLLRKWLLLYSFPEQRGELSVWGGQACRRQHKCTMHLFLSSKTSVILYHIYSPWCLCIRAEHGITKHIGIYNISEEENDCCSTSYSQSLLQQCPYTFLFQAFCSILNRGILKGADSALILMLVVKALGIEETVGYNWLWQLGDDQSPRVEHLKGNLHVSLSNKKKIFS